MVLRNADWKNQTHKALDGIWVVIGAVLFGMYLYQWWQTGEVVHIGLSGIMVVWGAVYFTHYWQPILYLLHATIVLTVTVIWIWQGHWKQLRIQTINGLHLLHVALSLYLFNYEEPRVPPQSEHE
jgi:hypothetical protein